MPDETYGYIHVLINEDSMQARMCLATVPSPGDASSKPIALNYDNINTKTWRVSVFRPTIKGPFYKYAHGTVNVSVIIGENRDEVIKALPSLIKNLTDLYEAVSKEGEDGK